MGGHKKSPSSSSPSSTSDRRQWQRIFRSLVEMLQSLQSQVETLASDREFLERYAQGQHERWSSRVRLLESRIAQMKEEDRKGRRFQAAKVELLIGMKQREAMCYKKQSELAESDLEDFHACLGVLTAEIAEFKEKMKDREADKALANMGLIDTSNKEGLEPATLRGEIQKLKQAYKTLSSKKEVEISALLAEKDFVWNQFKKMESDYVGLLKSKRLEAAQANEAAEKLQLNLEDLRSSVCEKDADIARLEAERARLDSNMRNYNQEAEQAKEKIELLQCTVEELSSLAKEKDDIILKLKTDLAKLEMDAIKKSRFSKDSNSQKPSRSALATPAGGRTRSSANRSLESAKPVGHHSRRYSDKQILESTKGGTGRKRKHVYGESSGSRASSAVNGLKRCSGRLGGQATPPVISPRLFSSDFKVPKLKKVSPTHSLI
ncbi:uncharacterized protein [Typha latifolia]|uniref:uncharacterized protein n=1 Tax=Typha latifolia TaxID=4733 RepID=UPI003C2FFFA0